MAKENIEDQVNFLKSKGYTVYSISRLNTYNNCQHGYHRSYVLKNTCLECGYESGNDIIEKCPKCGSSKIVCDRGVDNIYASLGGKIHDHLQDICDGVKTVDDMKKCFEEDFETDTLFMNFPSEKIKDNWKADMTNFVEDFKPLMYDKIMTERGFVTNINGVWLQGFIDVLAFDKDDVIILDWKTSSEFKGDKLKHAGRQLIIYKLAIEKILNKEVKRVGWYMLKYINVSYDGKVKQCNRGSWVKDRSGLIKTQLKKLGYNDYEKMIEDAINSNNLDNMPDEVKNRFKIDPCVVWYDVTNELVNETEEYIKNTVSQIEGKDIHNTKIWECRNIYKDKGFFCKNLCSYKDSCKALELYIKNNK